MPSFQQNFGKKIISWSFKEYEKPQRTSRWFIVFSAIVFLFFLYALFTKSYVFALLVVILALYVIKTHYEKPRRLTFTVFEKGILIGNKFYDYKGIDSFWIVYDPPIKKIYFELNNFIKSHIYVPFFELTPLELREILSKYIAEDTEREEEPFSDALARFLKL